MPLYYYNDVGNNFAIPGEYNAYSTHRIPVVVPTIYNAISVTQYTIYRSSDN